MRFAGSVAGSRTNEMGMDSLVPPDRSSGTGTVPHWAPPPQSDQRTGATAGDAVGAAGETDGLAAMPLGLTAVEGGADGLAGVWPHAAAARRTIAMSAADVARRGRAGGGRRRIGLTHANRGRPSALGQGRCTASPRAAHVRCAQPAGPGPQAVAPSSGDSEAVGASCSTVTSSWRPGRARPTSAPTATTAAPIQRAGWRPATYASGEAYDPLPEKTAARTATPNTPPISRIVLFAPDALPSSRWTDSREHDVGDRSEEQAHADAGEDERRDDDDVLDGRGDDGGEPRQADGLSVRPRRGAAALPSATPRARRSGRRWPASASTAGSAGPPGRARALDDLEELASRKIEPNIPKYIRNETPFAALKAADAEEPHRQHRLAGAPFAEDEADQSHDAGDEGGHDPAVGPAVLVAVDDAPHEGEQAAAGERQSGQVEALARAEGLVQSEAARARWPRCRSGTLIQKIACQASPSVIAPPTSGPMAMARPPMPPHAPRATARRSGATEADRIVRVSGRTMAPPTPWMARAMMRASDVVLSAAAVEPAVKMARPTMNIRRRPKRSPSAAPVQEQDGEREGVGVDDPLELLERCAKVEADDRQGGRHDEVVEADHEQGDRGDGERPGGGAATGHGSSLLSS